MSETTVRRNRGRQLQQKRTGLSPIVIGLIVLGLVVLLASAYVTWQSSSINPGQKIEAGEIENIHLQTLSDPHPPYNSNPPTSGHHFGGGTAPWGVHTQPFPDELTVHNLEHGGIIIHYRQDVDKETVDKLTALTRELQQQNGCIILQPRPVDKLDVPIAVTAWEWLLKLQAYDEASIRAFFQKHVNGPEAPEQICGQL